MASLNTLRTRFGVVLSIIIGLALLAFVLSLKTEMGFSGNDPKVGSIDGDKIKYSEYIEEYDRVKTQSGASEGDEQQADMLANATWQSLIAKHVLRPGFEQIGLSVGDAERQAMISGEYSSQAFYNAFADPRTGQYDVAAIAAFLAQAEGNLQAQIAWNYLNEQAVLEREVAKYMGLMRGGAYANALEVARGVEGANQAYSGRLICQKYNTLPDSLFEVSSGEINAYYKAHKERFKQKPSRTISYVVFNVSASDDDKLAIEQKARAAAEEFAAAEDLRAYVRSNRNAAIADRYVSAAQLPEAEAETFLAGKMYGPVLENDVWTMGRVIEQKMVPDSLGVRHIVLHYTQEKMADSLLTALRQGADFAQVASQYSAYGATAAKGGEVGVLPFSAFTDEFAEALADAKVGDIVKIASGDAIQLMQVYRADKPVKYLRIARVTYPIEASAETRRTMHNEAGSFMVNAKEGAESFDAVASAASLIPRTATLAQGERELSGLMEARDVVRWANNAEVGDVSEIFTVNGNYLVATLTGIDDNKYMPVEKAASQIRRMLLRDKKYDQIVKGIAGVTLEEQAKSLNNADITEFKDLKYPVYYIDRVGIEPGLIGAITTTEETGVLSAPIKGALGVYVYVVDDIAKSETQTPEAEQVRLQAQLENSFMQWSLPVVEQLSDIEDLRPTYF